MWVGTFGGGLELAEPTSDGKYKFRHFFQQTFGMRMVRVIEEDESGMVWVGTGEGICIFHPDSLIADGDNYHLFTVIQTENFAVMKSNVSIVIRKDVCGLVLPVRD